MISWQTLVLFISTSSLLAITPGPDILTVLTRGMTQGRPQAFASAAGFSLGNIGHTLFAVVGISAVLRASAVAFMMVKYAGAVYLLYVGYRIFTSPAGPMAVGQKASVRSNKAVFIQSVTANILNPKVALFFLAFFPQFIDPSRGTPALQMVTLGGVFVAVTFVIFGSVAYFAGFIGNALATRPRFSGIMNKTAGSFLIGLGLLIAWPDKR